MNEAFRKLVGITRRIVRFVEEVDCGIAVGRGRERAHGAGRRGADGRA